ncbi:MAG: hypothetical protein A2293_10725 [Elusimicrobia bacterium RIFOXYB2_FULL_49_7]|nr:MAG: hypothetical protein A2293_10725 [Elusimicrobia bacterium RIFOXYB2_FULL_49_7]
MNRFLAIVKKEFLQLRADPVMIRLMIGPAIIQLFIIGYALTVEVKEVTLGIVDRSRSPESSSLLTTLTRHPLFIFKGNYADEAGLREALDQGDIRIGLILSPDFASQLHSPEGAELGLLMDGTDANFNAVAAGYINAIFSGWTLGELRTRLARDGIDMDRMLRIQVTDDVRFNPRLLSTWYMIPALVVLLITMVTSLLTAFAIVKEKERGTFEQLVVTPVRPVHLIFGKCVPGIVVGLLEIGFFFTVALLWFRIPFRGSFAAFLFFSVLYMVSSLSIGILISTVAKSLQQVLFMVFFILIFFILLSGFFIPLENLPHWVRSLTLLNPVRFYMSAVRQIFLKGATLSQLHDEALMLLLIGATVFSVSFVKFSRKAG